MEIARLCFMRSKLRANNPISSRRSRSSKLTVVPAVTDYLERYPSHTRTPWYQADEVFAEYAPGSHEPQWLDLSDAGFERAVRVAFKQPLLSFIREGAETDLIDDGKLERALDRLGYR